jgi:hypothetical protein
MKRFIAFLVLLGLTSCASIEGTRDKSLTLKRNQLTTNITSIAMLPIKENAVQAGLSTKMESSLYFSLLSNLQGVNIIGVEDFRKVVSQSDAIEKFGQWLAGYEATSIINGKLLGEIRETIGTDYFLLVRSISLTREKIRGVDTGYSGMVSDAKNVYRSDLKIYVELIDLVNGQMAWQGVGHAENINSPRKDLDLILVIHHEKEPGITAFLDEMIKTATAGVARELFQFSRTYQANYQPAPSKGQVRKVEVDKVGTEEKTVPASATSDAEKGQQRGGRGVTSAFGGLR